MGSDGAGRDGPRNINPENGPRVINNPWREPLRFLGKRKIKHNNWDARSLRSRYDGRFKLNRTTKPLAHVG